MRSKRRFGADEINLTPLLDVLFVVLFTILLTGFSQQSQRNDKVENLEQQVEELQEQVSDYKKEINAQDLYTKDAVILSVDNYKNGVQHILRITKDSDSEEIVLGINNTATFKRQINAYILDLVEKHEEQPIYVVFNCDENSIYKVEYDAIQDEMKQLESNNKEVFFKISQEVE